MYEDIQKCQIKTISTKKVCFKNTSVVEQKMARTKKNGNALVQLILSSADKISWLNEFL